MVGIKGRSGRPGGNPDLNKYKKTGPTTLQGKFTIALQNLIMGKYSKTLAAIRFCDVCPLQPTRIRRPDGEYELIKKCHRWQEGHNACLIPRNEDFIDLVRFYKLIDEKGAVEAMKMAAALQMADAMGSRTAEAATKGHSAFYSAEHTKNMVETLDKIEKNISGEKHINVNIDATKSIPIDDILNRPRKNVIIIETEDENNGR